MAMSATSTSARRAHDDSHDDELLAEELTHVPDDRDGIEYVERARAAGAEGQLRYIGAGMQGYVFADARGHAYKVARFDTPSCHRLLSEEYHWLRDANGVPEIRRLVAKVYGYYPELGVLEREEVIGEPMRSWSDESRLTSVHEKIAHALRDRWTAPEFKGDSYVRTSSGPVLVDAGFALRRGVLLINQAIQKLDGENVGETPDELAFAVRMESGRTIDPVTANDLATRLEQMPHERRENPVRAPMRWSSRKENPTTIGNELILWHGGRPWQGPVEVQAGPIRSTFHGPGVYLTTSAETARKYAKGGGRVFRFALDPSLVLLDDQRLPVTEMERWLRDQPRLRGRDKVIHDLHRFCARTNRTDVPIYVLLNLLVNHEAHGGAHGVAFARWMSALGIDAQLVDPPMKGGEDWLVLFNPEKVISVRPARPDEVADTPRVRR